MSEAYNRAVRYGNVHLNKAFVQRYRPIRLWKRSSVRISAPDIFWMIIMLLPSALFMLGLGWLLGSIPGLNGIFGWWWVFLSPVFAFLAGRYVSARFTPYGRHTGEGLGEYIKVNRELLKDHFIRRLYGFRRIYGEVLSRAGGRNKIVRATYWLGTAPSEHIPLYNPHTDNRYVNVRRIPMSEPTDWVKESNRRSRNRARAQREVRGL